MLPMVIMGRPDRAPTRASAPGDRPRNVAAVRRDPRDDVGRGGAHGRPTPARRSARSTPRSTGSRTSLDETSSDLAAAYTALERTQNKLPAARTVLAQRAGRRGRGGPGQRRRRPGARGREGQRGQGPGAARHDDEGGRRQPHAGRAVRRADLPGAGLRPARHGPVEHRPAAVRRPDRPRRHGHGRAERDDRAPLHRAGQPDRPRGPPLGPARRLGREEEEGRGRAEAGQQSPATPRPRPRRDLDALAAAQAAQAQVGGRQARRRAGPARLDAGRAEPAEEDPRAACRSRPSAGPRPPRGPPPRPRSSAAERQRRRWRRRRRAAAAPATATSAARRTPATSAPSSACASTRSCTTGACTPGATTPPRAARRSRRPRAGTIIMAGCGGGYGNRVVIDHGIVSGEGLATHLQPPPVDRGSASGRVSRGQVIGYERHHRRVHRLPPALRDARERRLRRPAHVALTRPRPAWPDRVPGPDRVACPTARRREPGGSTASDG